MKPCVYRNDAGDIVLVVVSYDYQYYKIISYNLTKEKVNYEFNLSEFYDKEDPIMGVELYKNRIYVYNNNFISCRKLTDGEFL